MILKEAIVKKPFQEDPGRTHRTWEAAGSRVEAALFVSVQAVMLVCIVLVAVQLFASA